MSPPAGVSVVCRVLRRRGPPVPVHRVRRGETLEHSCDSARPAEGDGMPSVSSSGWMMSGPGTESIIARRSSRFASVSRNESSVHALMARASGSSRSGRYAKTRSSGAPDVCVRSCRIVAFASGLSGLNCPMRSSSERRPSSTQRSTSVAVNTCVSPSRWNGVSVLVAMDRSMSCRPNDCSQMTSSGPTIEAARPGIPA